MKVHTIQLHIGDITNGTNDMTTTEFGAYVRLLLKHYALGPQGLPAHPAKLARIAGLTLDKWKKIAPAVLSKFTLQGGEFYTQQRVCKELNSYLAKADSNRDKALKRWDNADATAMPQQSQSNAIQNPIPNTQNPIAATRSRAGAGQRGKITPIFTPEQIEKSVRGEPGYDPEASGTEVLPGSWHDAAEARGMGHERIYKSFRRFKELSDFPYQKKRWMAWIENEGSFIDE